MHVARVAVLVVGDAVWRFFFRGSARLRGQSTGRVRDVRGGDHAADFEESATPVVRVGSWKSPGHRKKSTGRSSEY